MSRFYHRWADWTEERNTMDIDATFAGTKGVWKYVPHDEYFNAQHTIRMNGKVVARVFDAKGTQFNGLAPQPNETFANGLMLAASKHLAQAALSANLAVAAFMRDPELSIDWQAIYDETEAALVMAGMRSNDGN